MYVRVYLCMYFGHILNLDQVRDCYLASGPHVHNIILLLRILGQFHESIVFCSE